MAQLQPATQMPTEQQLTGSPEFGILAEYHLRTAIHEPIEAPRLPSLRERGGAKIGALVLTGALAVGGALAWKLGAFGGGDSKSSEVPEGTIATPTTDTELLLGGYNCAPEDAPEQNVVFDYSKQINFLNQKPELVEELEDFIVNDSSYGMGEDAWQTLLDEALDNPSTPKKNKVKGNEDVDTYAHKMIRFPVMDETTFINFTCEGQDGDGEFDIHAVNLKTLNQSNFANGFVVNEIGLAKWSAKAENKDRFKVQFLGTQEGKKSKEEKLFHIIVEADGCKNQLRLPEDTPDTPGTSGTTVPEASTTTKPQEVKGYPAPTLAPPATNAPSGTTGTTNGPVNGRIPGGGDSGEGAPPNGGTTPTTEVPPATAPPVPDAEGPAPRV